ncbi:hypothetical protein Droror1_Dr00003961 [Drosera rotundifolia]
MAAAAKSKGTMTPLSSIFPADEALKASIRVQEAIADRRRQVDEVKAFVADNNNLINLVQRLPDELQHDIMVPFGKAAFFPGRLVHTNEFLVFIGEGHYVDRTSKQTVDILKRRGKVLESQLDSLEAIMQDLKSEASFFQTTAVEAAEGLVEIREDYIDEDSEETNQSQYVSAASGAVKGSSPPDDDDEYARLMSRLDELEKEELATESMEDLDESDLDLDVQYLENTGKKKVEQVEIEIFQHNKNGAKVLQHSITGKSPQGATTSQVQSSLQSILRSKNEVQGQMPKPVGRLLPKPSTDSLKAFSGSIIERTSNLPNNSIQETPAQPSGEQPSKPVSRFKMQRR